MFGNGKVDDIRWDRTKIREHDPRVLIDKLVQPSQALFWENKVVQVLVVVFQVQGIVLHGPVHLISSPDVIGESILGGICIARWAVPDAMLTLHIPIGLLLGKSA